VYNSIGVNGELVHYDGVDDGVLNVNGQILFTHEFLWDFLDQAAESRATMSAFWRGKMRGWRRNLISSDSFVMFVLELIDRPFMVNCFINSVFDFITRLAFDYVDAFSCQCGDRCRNGNIVTAVYDNCCKFMQTAMLRHSRFASDFLFIIDALHSSGHSHCDPLHNSKINVALKQVNVAINEQKNRILRHMELSLAFMTQMRAAVYARCVCVSCVEVVIVIMTMILSFFV
jgi:hypothetical protein